MAYGELSSLKGEWGQTMLKEPISEMFNMSFGQNLTAQNKLVDGSHEGNAFPWSQHVLFLTVCH